ncbi:MULTISPECIES: dipeptidase [unclassified Crossiella]|uniref:dipeptidase n=1 Tax=unclassified Crossiella TaxID=2620835 RepID=UPI001FFEAC0C|nr:MULTISPECIES: dipeptidase [unclassified Crossiella]MCK2240449.1 dipeptidase [Crossiella sp. S99.2]MCK2253100.1 dipeptidase [Crossiella sp. S99.1]
MPTSGSLGRSQELLRRVPLVDGHNDLPWAIRDKTGGDLTAIELTVEQPGLHTDLVRLRHGGVGAQFWSVYVPCRFLEHRAVTAVLEQIELVHELVERYPEQLRLARSAAEVQSAFADGRIASLLGAEGGHCIGESLGALRALFRLGVRYLTLTHNDNTPWADSATDQPAAGGLTDFGREVVREMNRLGMLVDLSHVAPSTMWHALETSAAPVIFSHSSCRAVTDHPRNVPDEVLRELPGNGGVCMITFVPAFVSADPVRRAGRADVVAHLEHAREVAGIDHIGIGGDYDGTGELPDGLEDVSRYPELFADLMDRGWSEQDLTKLAGGNVLRVLEQAEKVAAELRGPG